MSDTTLVHRTCSLCEAHCGVTVEVDSGARRVVAVRGDEQDAFSRGYICPKAWGLKGLYEDPDRLRRPVRRVGSEWQEIGWEEAFDEVATRLRRMREEHGPEALATYVGNPNAHDMGSGFYLPALLRGLGTRKRFSASSVDQLPKMLSSCAMYGAPLAVPIPDVDRTDYLLVLGANPLASNGSLMTAPDLPGRLRRLRERGGRLVVIDPRRSETARIADEHLFIRPGTDAWLLFSLVHELFEADLVTLGAVESCARGLDEVRTLAKDFPPEATAHVTGIEAATVRRLAREIAGAERAACYGRIGTCTQEFGTLASWLVDLVTILTGNLDRPGGALFPRPAHAPGREGGKARPVAFGRWRSSVRGLPEAFGELPVATMAEEIDAAGEKRIRALLTVAGNPVLSTPNGGRLERALEGLDFMASVDFYVNETTRFADVILPPVSPLERSNYEVAFNGLAIHHHAKYSPRAVEPPPDSRDQWEILAELAGRVNGADLAAVDDLVLGTVLGSAVGPGSATPDVSVEEARAMLGDERGPERVLDLMLRAGPYGDHFDDSSDGLSLARLKAAEHGIDLGPLAPRLPAMLATESGALELAPELIVADVARLRARLAERAADDRMMLIGRRHLRSNNSWMGNVHALAKGRDRCTLLVSPLDADRIGVWDGGRARVRSRVGELEAPVVVSDEMMPGVVSLPHGFGHDAPGARLSVARRHAGVNSNLLTDEEAIDALSCNAVLDGIPVEVSAV
ncbi:MAG: molybdopterin-dependent oxidoreductase [Myxococcota bacterium]|nr:molybdopterin-dependent oxidoreductase [Myxococcota bacterium]